MTVSFRTRLFVSAALIVGAVMSAVLYLGWTRVLGFEIERLERRLCIEARRLATQPFDQNGVARLQNDIMAKLHLSNSQQLMLRYQASTFEQTTQSANWSTAVALDGPQWRATLSGAAPPREAAQDRPPPPPPRLGENLPPEPERSSPRGRPQEPGMCALASFEVAAQQWRAARYTQASGRSVLAVDLAASTAELRAAFTQALKRVVPLALALTAVGAWLLAALTMRPVNRLSEAMKGVTPNALDKRLQSVGEDREFKVLIEAYNTMLARLQASFAQATRFSADAAHELKTPLTILQGRIEQSLRVADTCAQQLELTELLDEVGRLAAITRKLLMLSQSDAGRLELQRVPIDLSGMLNEMTADAQMLLSHQTLHCTVEPNLQLQGDALLLRQLFNNLISNAVRYCLDDGCIKLTARASPSGIEVVFSNATPAIGQEQREQFFERFYRGDAAHNRRVDGSGLGLSLAREIARAHGGDLVLIPSALDEVALRLTL